MGIIYRSWGAKIGWQCVARGLGGSYTDGLLLYNRFLITVCSRTYLQIRTRVESSPTPEQRTNEDSLDVRTSGVQILSPRTLH